MPTADKTHPIGCISLVCNLRFKNFVWVSVSPEQSFVSEVVCCVTTVRIEDSVPTHWPAFSHLLQLLGFWIERRESRLEAAFSKSGYQGSSVPHGTSLGEEMATCFSILARRIPWTEEPDRLQSLEWQESEPTPASVAQDGRVLGSKNDEI